MLGRLVLALQVGLVLELGLHGVRVGGTEICNISVGVIGNVEAKIFLSWVFLPTSGD